MFFLNIVVNAASTTQSGANPVQFICGGWIVGVTVRETPASGPGLTLTVISGETLPQSRARLEAEGRRATDRSGREGA